MDEYIHINPILTLVCALMYSIHHPRPAPFHLARFIQFNYLLYRRYKLKRMSQIKCDDETLFLLL